MEEDKLNLLSRRVNAVLASAKAKMEQVQYKYMPPLFDDLHEYASDEERRRAEKRVEEEAAAARAAANGVCHRIDCLHLSIATPRKDPCAVVGGGVL